MSDIISKTTYRYFANAQNAKNLKKTTEKLGYLKIISIWKKIGRKSVENKKNRQNLSINEKNVIANENNNVAGPSQANLVEENINDKKKLKRIMTRYSLISDDDNVSGSLKENYLNEVGDQKILKAIFKDKKLNKLWIKAEQSGFTEEELKALKEEFQHHQDKIDEYYAFINAADVKNKRDMNKLENEITPFNEPDASEKSTKDKTNTVREKHRELKDGYDRLHKVSSTGPDTKEFFEPKVSGLWKLAVRGDFTQEELESLHTELKHYEHRLLKVRTLAGQMSALKDRGLDGLEKEEKLHSTEGQRILEERISKQKRKVDKLHEDLEMRILQRHSEL
ncbi:unnamed protein product, partial [Meganyctiphanes norvegica]